MGESRILYSSNECTRCKLVKQMLDIHNVRYTEINDKRIMIDKEIENVPALEINEKIMEYQEVLTWLQQNNYYSLWGDNKDESN